MAYKTKKISLDTFRIPEKFYLVLLALLFSAQILQTTMLEWAWVYNTVFLIDQLVLSLADVLIFIRFVQKLAVLKKNHADLKPDYLSLFRIVFPVLLIVLFSILTSLGIGQELERIQALITMVALLEDCDSHAILKCVYRCGVMIVMIMFLLSMLGLVENNRGNSFGFIYRTDYAAHYLYLFLIFCFYYAGKLTWQGELGLLICIFAIFRFVQGKTSCICMAAVAFATFLRHYHSAQCIPYQELEHPLLIRILFRLIYLPIALIDWMIRKLPERLFTMMKNWFRRIQKWSFVLFSGMIIGLTLFLTHIPADFISRLPLGGTLHSRLLLSMIGFEQYPISLLGNQIPQQGFGGTDGYSSFYFMLDSSYIRLLLQYGVIIFALMVGLMTFLQFRLYRKRMFYELFLMTIVALDCTLEHHLAELAYNALAVLTLASLDTRSVASRSILPFRSKANKTQNRHSKPFLSVIRAVGICIFGGITVLALITSYRISNYKNWMPVQNATVILTGSQIGGIHSEKSISLKLEKVYKYLRIHPEAVCLVSAPEDETTQMCQDLLARGISADRIFTDNATDLESTLENCDAIIQAHSLSKRVAFCAFPMQQYRISLLAHRREIPINFLDMDVPGELYLPNYLSEQVKLSSIILENLFTNSGSIN